MLTNTDLARREKGRAAASAEPPCAEDFLLVDDSQESAFHIDYIAEDRVSHYMSNAPQTIDGQQSLIEAARYLEGAGLHRLVVVDDKGRPIGVISGLDILGAMLGCVQQ